MSSGLVNPVIEVGYFTQVSILGVNKVAEYLSAGFAVTITDPVCYPVPSVMPISVGSALMFIDLTPCFFCQGMPVCAHTCI